MTCNLYGTADFVLYSIEAWVTGWGYTTRAEDTDWSHYFGYNDYTS